MFFLFELLLMILTLGIGFNYILILKNWHFESHAPDQYRLEKINYLLSISGRILLAGRMIAFGLLIFVVDSLADVIVGAMCASGIFSDYGQSTVLFILLYATIFLFLLWYLVERLDEASEDFRFIKTKAAIFLSGAVLSIATFYLLNEFIFSIKYSGILQCCSRIYPVESQLTFSVLSTSATHLFLFSGLLLFLILVDRWQGGLLSIPLNILFLYLGIAFLINSISPYIYELPTHRCPFCLFKSEYGYIGYPFFFLLGGGTMSGLAQSIIHRLNGKQAHTIQKTACLAKLIFLSILCYYPLSYYIKNGVLL